MVSDATTLEIGDDLPPRRPRRQFASDCRIEIKPMRTTFSAIDGGGHDRAQEDE